MLDPSILVGSTQIPNQFGVVTPDALKESELRAASAERFAKMLAIAVEIQSELDGCGDLATASLKATRLLMETLNAKRVQIAWRKADDKACDLIADTATDSLALSKKKLQREIGAQFNAAAEEVLAREMIALYPSDDAGNRHALLAIGKYSESISANTLICAPLVDSQGTSRGTVFIVDPAQHCETTGSDKEAATPIQTTQHAMMLIEALRFALADKLAWTEVMQPRRWERMVRSLSDKAANSKRMFAIAIVAAIALAMLIPMHYQVAATCELQPVKQRVVAAPFDGPLEKVLVRPGDVVAEGETLAKINPRELDYQLAGLRAELRRAIQEEKKLMADHDFGAIKIAKLEAERIAMEKELLQYQRSNLEIRSPLAGVVVSGDLKRSEGTPLSKGDPMFEIAPLGEMVVEISIPESDFVHVQAGMPVVFYLHAVPSETLTGKLQAVHPAAELRGNENVFIGEVAITDTKGILRPGMRGRSWIQSDRHPLGWNLFHKAFFSLRTAIGW